MSEGDGEGVPKGGRKRVKDAAAEKSEESPSPSPGSRLQRKVEETATMPASNFPFLFL